MAIYNTGKVPDYLNPNANLPKQNVAGSDNRFQIFAPSPALKTGSSSRAAAIAAAAAKAGNRSSTSGSNSTLSVSGSNLNPGRTTSTGYSSRAAALAAGVDGGNRSSTSGSGKTLKVSGSQLGPGKTSTGDLVPEPEIDPVIPDLTDPNLDPNPGPGDGDGSSTAVPDPAAAEEAGISKADYLAQLEAAINGLLEGTYIDFQGSAADELRRLENYRNQLYGNDAGMIGSVQRQQTTDLNDRRRLAAQRAVSGMLQGGAYAGAQRGLGTQQQASQAYGIQEMQRPFLEQVQSDRLREFGLDYNSDGKQLGYTDWFDDMIPNMSLDENGKLVLDKKESWATTSTKGRAAEAKARNAAIQQLLQRGVTL